MKIQANCKTKVFAPWLRSVPWLRPVPGLRIVCLTLLLLFIAGCGEVPVAQSISQTQANEIVAVLNRNGIYATSEKQVGIGDSYAVEVKRSYYAQAIDLLNRKGLPGKPQEKFSELIAQKGIIPDSREVEALRLDHALGVQLQEMLDNLPSVVASKVIVRVNFLTEESKPGASVVLQENGSESVDEAEISDLIAKTVPGLEIERIHISSHEILQSDDMFSEEGVFNKDGSILRVPLTNFLFGWRVPVEDYNGFALSLVGFVLLIGFVGGIVGYWYGYMQQDPSVTLEGEHRRDFINLPSGALRLDSQKEESSEEDETL